MRTTQIEPDETDVPRMARPEIHDAAPGLGWYTDHVLYHQVWNRPDLSRRDRSLVTLAALVTTGRMPQLKGHIGRGLDHGVLPGEIVEIITQLAFFAGWPSVMSSVPVMTGVFADRGVDAQAAASFSGPPAEPSARSEPIAPAGGPYTTLLRECTTRPFADELWTRAALSPRDRSLVTFAAVVAQGEHGQLAAWARRARQDGVQETELREAVAHLAFYIGWARAAAAATTLDSASN